MKEFLGENFFLGSRTAEILYHGYAKDMPILDYHCHLNPKEIAENKKYRSITELWLGGDHYKWRALRLNGVEEKYITGDASDWEKFLKWAETVPKCIGNPMYQWVHLELKRYFGIEKLLSPETAAEIWDTCNDLLKNDEFSARGLISRSNVKALCTTDDPADTLEYHRTIAADKSFAVRVLPAMRPDKAINIAAGGFIDWIGKLSAAAQMNIDSYDDLKKVLRSRIEFFHEAGCRISDHGMEPPVFCRGTEEEVADIFSKRLAGKQLSDIEIQKYKTELLLFLGREYSAKNWVMQLHIGALRNNCTRLGKLLGADAGCDAIGDFHVAEPLAGTLDALDETAQLPKTIVYCLNPSANEVLAAMNGSFQYDGVPAKIQFGSGWWYNDQKDGMHKQMTALANIGLLSRFVGMLTDSRSFLSYTRHECFRRLLCDLIGGWAENGEVPGDVELLGKMVQDICYNNAEEYFKL